MLLDRYSAGFDLIGQGAGGQLLGTSGHYLDGGVGRPKQSENPDGRNDLSEYLEMQIGLGGLTDQSRVAA